VFQYEASGIAIGPYPGTFTERGTVVIGPHDRTFGGARLVGLISELEVTFEIISGAFTVRGTKRLADLPPPAETGLGSCAEFPSRVDPFVQEGYARTVDQAFLVYSATITGPGGTFTDRGDQGEPVGNPPRFDDCFGGGTGCSRLNMGDVTQVCRPERRRSASRGISSTSRRRSSRPSSSPKA
jgi:hypothetical protein